MAPEIITLSPILLLRRAVINRYYSCFTKSEDPQEIVTHMNSSWRCKNSLSFVFKWAKIKYQIDKVQVILHPEYLCTLCGKSLASQLLTLHFTISHPQIHNFILPSRSNRENDDEKGLSQRTGSRSI